MKTKFFLLFTVALLMAQEAVAQITFSVSPGISFNTASVGYKINDRLVTYIGFQHFNFSMNYDQTYEEYDFNTGQLRNVEESFSVRGNLYIPNLGVKFFIVEQQDLKAYSTLNISKPFISGKVTQDGVNDPTFEEAIDNLNIWGGEFGFGAEYFLDDHFSIGGEFGIRYLRVKDDNTSDRTIYNPNTGNYEDSEVHTVMKFSTSPTYSRITLNYYFD